MSGLRFSGGRPRGQLGGLDALDALGEAAPIIPVGGELARALDDGAEGGELRGLDGTGSMPTGSTSTARARPGAR